MGKEGATTFRLTKILLKRAFSLGGRGFDEGMLAEFCHTGSTRLVYPMIGSGSVGDVGLPDKGQTASTAPGSLRFPFTFLASCLATARIFVQQQLHRH